MAIVALHSAATGLSALSQNIDIIANNLANVNTTAFKSQRANFEDLIYQQKVIPGVENANGDKRPAGLQVGLGTKISNTQYDFTVGSPIQTDRQLDLYIQGQGFFQVRTLEGGGSQTGYTRAGNFFQNSEGQIVLGNSQGPKLEPAITIPQGTTQVEITADGTVYAHNPTSATPTNIGRMQLANFVNQQGLKSLGGNVYAETPASGPPIVGNPSETSFGTILQNSLESSNVDPVKELVSLIKTQRAFEMNSQTIQAADQSLQVVANLRRG